MCPWVKFWNYYILNAVHYQGKNLFVIIKQPQISIGIKVAKFVTVFVFCATHSFHRVICVFKVQPALFPFSGYTIFEPILIIKKGKNYTMRGLNVFFTFHKILIVSPLSYLQKQKKK